MVPLQILLVLAYLGFFATIGLLSSRKATGLEQWVSAGRDMPWWLIGPSCGALLVAAAATVGAAGSGASYGVAAPVTFGLALGAAFFGMAQLVGPLYRRSGLLTMPSMLSTRFRSRATFRSYILLAVAMVPLIVGVEMVGIARLFQASLFGGDAAAWTWSLLLALAAVWASVAMGGMWSVAWTNLVHTVAMLAGLGAGVAYAASTFGGLSDLWARLPPRATDVGAGWEAMERGEGFLLFPLMLVLSYLFLPLIVPVFPQVAAAGRNVRHVRAGFALGGAIAIAVTTLSGLLGMYMETYRPDAIRGVHPDLALPAFGMAVHPLAGGLIYIGVLAAVLSTVGPIVVAVSTILAMDVGLAKGPVSPRKTLRLGRAISFALPALAVAGSAAVSGERIVTSISVMVGFTGVVAPTVLAGFYWRRATGRGAIESLRWGSLVYGLWLAGWLFRLHPAFVAVHPLVPGVGAALLAMVLFSYRSPPPKPEALKFMETVRGTP